MNFAAAWMEICRVRMQSSLDRVGKFLKTVSNTTTRVTVRFDIEAKRHYKKSRRLQASAQG